MVVVDDGSTDATAALLAERAAATDAFGRPRTITRAPSGGPAKGRNAGWRAARAALIAFTDDDCEPAPQWLEQALRAAREHPRAFVQGRTAPQPRELDRLGPFSRTLAVEGGAGPWYPTCNMLYPRALLERLGGFDESFPRPGGEDTDLAWRAIEAGAEPVYAGQALVHHAVEDLGPGGHLRVALRWADAIGMFRHRGLREQALLHGIFWKCSHLLLVQTLAGAALSVRFKPALALAVPYARHLRGRCQTTGAPLPLAAYFALHDLLETYATVRGALRERVLVV